MPHIHSMSIFDVDRIEIAFDANCNCYQLKLFAGDQEMPDIRMSVWRNAEGGKRPDLIVDGWNANQLQEENVDALIAHNEESDR
jgi:hypothetical protein